MKILLVVKQKKNIDTFRPAIGCLLDRGHSVTVAVQQHHEERDERLARDVDRAGFSVVRCPFTRTDEWTGAAALLRSLRDCVQYLRPELRNAVKLQTRTVQKLTQELLIPKGTDDLAAGLRGIPAPQVSRLEALLKLAERSLPSDALYDEFITSQRPDVLLLSPLVHFGSAQADLVASARRLGVAVGMLLFSWDNLSTKGCLHRRPDWMFVWNEQQRREAQTLHGFPSERVIVVGAPRFDSFFELKPEMTREAFHGPLGLDPSKPTLLYVCSSRFVSDGELVFIRRWVNELRDSSAVLLRESNIVVRPHPDVPLLPPEEPIETVRWPAWSTQTAQMARPFGDPRAIVLRTAARSQQGLYESVSQSAAVVGLNTSAELEAGIVGRPVFTILADEREADGQHTTVHFHYLLKDQGGFVTLGHTFPEHLAQLEAALGEPPDPAPIRAFIEQFLRPHGIEKPVAPLLAEAIERTFATPVTAVEQPELPAADEDDRAEAVAPEHAGENVVQLEHEGIRINVHATPEITSLMRNREFAFEKNTIEWLMRGVGIGDVVYDLAAGVGVYTVIAAKHRGAMVVAFESGYASFGRLCDNLLLNACDGRVVPVPLELSDRDGLKELKYERWRAGQDRHRLREADWRVRPTSGEHPYVQPVVVTPLDAVVGRYALPPPNHLRLSRQVAAPAVLAGAAATLAAPGLKSIFATVEWVEADRVIAQLAALGWEVDARHPASGEAFHLGFRRQPSAAAEPRRLSRMRGRADR